MTTKILSRLESFSMIPKFIKKRLMKKTEMSYWSELSGITKKQMKLTSRLKTYFKIRQLEHKVCLLETMVNSKLAELEKKIEIIKLENGVEIEKRFLKSEKE